MNQAVTTFDHELHKMGEQYDLVLPAHLPLERFERCIRNAVSQNQQLLKCDRASLWRAGMTAAVLGLEVDGGVLGQGYLIPYKGQVQFVVGYKGLVALAYNAGYIVEGHVVRSSDEFDYEYGLEPKLFHKPMNSGLRGEENPIVGAYATARSADMPPVFEFMEAVDIIAQRDRSAGFKNNPHNSPWTNDFAAMARKTPIRLLASHLPLNVQKAVALEALHDRGLSAHIPTPEDGVIEVVAEAVEEDPPLVELPAELDDDAYARAGRPKGYQFNTERQAWVRYGV